MPYNSSNFYYNRMNSLRMDRGQTYIDLFRCVKHTSTFNVYISKVNIASLNKHNKRIHIKYGCAQLIRSTF